MDALRTDLRGEPAREGGEGLSVVAVRLEGSDSEIMLVQRDEEPAEQEAGPEPAERRPAGDKDAAGGSGLETADQALDAVAAEPADEVDRAEPGAGADDAEAGAWTSAAAREAALGVPGGPAAAGRMHALVRLLSAYAVHDPDIGYCQGMSDLAAAALRVVPGETLAFACFERIMRAARRNFRHDEAGIRHVWGHGGGWY